MHRRSVVLFFSDLLEPSQTIEAAFKELRFKGHECLIFQILDRDEVEFPFDDTAVFEDLETGGKRRVAPAAAREGYLAQFGAFMDGHQEMFRSLEMPHCVIRTDEDPLEALAMFLVRRKQLR